MNTKYYFSVPPRVSTTTFGSDIPLGDVIETCLEEKRPITLSLYGEAIEDAFLFLLCRYRNYPLVRVSGPAYRGRYPYLRISIAGAKNNGQVEHCLVSPWTRDDAIKYLLAVHPSECRSVMSRLRSEDFTRLQFFPRLIVFVLDALASNLQATDVTDLLTDELERLLLIDLKSIKDPTLGTDADNETKRRLSYFAKAQLINFDDNDSVDCGSIPASRWTKMLLGVVEIKARFVARHLVAQLIKQEDPPDSPQLNAMVLRETAAMIRRAGNDTTKLQDFLVGHHENAMSASLLLALNPEWKPESVERVQYDHGFFPNAKWMDCKLNFAVFWDCNLRGAKLTGSKMRGCESFKCDFTSIDCSNTELGAARFFSTDLTHARFVDCTADKAVFDDCPLNEASFHGAILRGVKFDEVDLSKADFTNANLRRACIVDCELSEVDFTKTKLIGAELRKADLRTAIFEETDLSRADLSRSTLEGQTMKNCRFRKTNLENADLTDTKIHHACMTKANLENARLAQIDWTDCDLRWANLKNVTFHFGSTRCGLVGSPYPSHGTRTGFYTEELADLYFQQPEVIRKASLVGCDLRGADITGVDFYLIDLRDAKLTRSQRAQAAKMGAILD